MSRIALLVGVDEYPADVGPLSGCVADALALGAMLGKHADGSPNFSCRRLLGARAAPGEARVTRAALIEQARSLFQKEDADVAVFFFAGHGGVTKRGSVLVTQDARPEEEGVPMAEIVDLANASPARERVIILDCCHAGAVDQLLASAIQQPLRLGTSILAACRDKEFSVEKAGRGLFSSLVCDALEGGAADVVGAVTVASVYAYVDQVMAPWEQRPLLKANVSKLIPLRFAPAAVAAERLRRLTAYFPSEDHFYGLDPSHEPTAEPRHPENEAAFRDLQQFRAARLVAPDNEEHMYDAAMRSGTCSLTPLGRFYWRRVQAGKL